MPFDHKMSSEGIPSTEEFLTRLIITYHLCNLSHITFLYFIHQLFLIKWTSRESSDRKTVLLQAKSLVYFPCFHLRLSHMLTHYCHVHCSVCVVQLPPWVQFIHATVFYTASTSQSLLCLCRSTSFIVSSAYVSQKTYQPPPPPVSWLHGDFSCCCSLSHIICCNKHFLYSIN